MAARTREPKGREHVRAGARSRILLARVNERAPRSTRDVDLGLWSVGMARPRRPRCRMAPPVDESRSAYPRDSSERSGARVLANDSAAHTRAPRPRLRAEHVSQ